jgi:hypothetical protein
VIGGGPNSGSRTYNCHRKYLEDVPLMNTKVSKCSFNMKRDSSTL